MVIPPENLPRFTPGSLLAGMLKDLNPSIVTFVCKCVSNNIQTSYNEIVAKNHNHPICFSDLHNLIDKF